MHVVYAGAQLPLTLALVASKGRLGRHAQLAGR
jgi:hypothetical protein